MYFFYRGPPHDRAQSRSEKADTESKLLYLEPRLNDYTVCFTAHSCVIHTPGVVALPSVKSSVPVYYSRYGAFKIRPRLTEAFPEMKHTRWRSTSKQTHTHTHLQAETQCEWHVERVRAVIKVVSHQMDICDCVCSPPPPFNKESRRIKVLILPFIRQLRNFIGSL